MGMTCVTLLRQVADGTISITDDNRELFESCLNRVTAENERDTAAMKLDAARDMEEALQIQQRFAAIVEQSNAWAKGVWDFIAASGEPDNDRLDKLLRMVDYQFLRDQVMPLFDARDFSRFEIAFGALPTDVQQALFDAATEE